MRKNGAGGASGIGVVVLLALAAACGGAADPTERLLARLEEAAEARDAAAVVERLTPGFRGRGGMDRAAAGAELRRLFALYRELDVVISDVRSTGDDPPRVTCRVDVTGRPDLPGLEALLPAASAYRFDLELARTRDEYAVVGAEWERIDTAPASP